MSALRKVHCDPLTSRMGRKPLVQHPERREAARTSRSNPFERCSPVSGCRKLREKCSFRALLPFTVGTLRPQIPDIAAVSGIWGPGIPAALRQTAFDRGQVLRGGLIRHWRLTLQQRAQPKSCIYGSAGKEIPELTRRSGINGTRNILIRHDQRSGH